MKVRSTDLGSSRCSHTSPLADQARAQNLLKFAIKISKQRREDYINKLRRGEFNCDDAAQQILMEAMRSEYKENVSLSNSASVDTMILDDSNCTEVITDENSFMSANEISTSILDSKHYYSDDDDFFSSEEHHSLMVKIAETIIFDMTTDENQLLIDALYDGEDSTDWALLESELTNESLVVCPFCVKSYIDFKADFNIGTCKCGEIINLYHDDHGLMDAMILKQLFSNAYIAHETHCNQEYDKTRKNDYKVIRGDNNAYGHCSLCNFFVKIL